MPLALSLLGPHMGRKFSIHVSLRSHVGDLNNEIISNPSISQCFLPSLNTHCLWENGASEKRQRMKEDKQGISETSSKSSKAPMRSIDTYAAQCKTCYKWRVIATQEEYEDIRSKIPDDPFVCDRKPGATCDDPADIEYDATRTWVIDRPGIPKTPKGFKRSLVLRRDFSKMDAYYITPTGKKLRTRNEIAAFLEANPKYKDISLSHFNFTSPKVMEDTIPEDAVKKVSTSGNSNKRVKASKDSAEDAVKKVSTSGNSNKRVKASKDSAEDAVKRVKASKDSAEDAVKRVKASKDSAEDAVKMVSTSGNSNKRVKASKDSA